MFVDLRVLEDGRVLETDICIVGAGPAGITVANEFNHAATRVCLVESGNLEADSRIQDLADGEMVGHPEHDLRSSRDRQFGGCTNSWAGACAPMSRSDFEFRPWINLEGWPLSKRDLDAHYERAQAMLDLGTYCYEPDCWAGDDVELLKLDPKKLENRIWQLSPRTNFGEIYRAPLGSSTTTTVLLNATATEILTDEQAGIAKGVLVRTLDGQSATILAKFVILACGAIDNARLLLLSRRHAPAGLGNGYDLVGRYFAQHPHVSAASLRTIGPKHRTKGYKDFKRGAYWLRTRIGLSEDAQRQHGVLNPVATLINRFISDSLTQSQSIGYVSLKRVLLDLQHGRVPVNLAAEMARIAKDIKGISVGLVKHLRNQSGALYIMSEQFPNPDSRVTLSSRRDALGLEQARVDWRLLPIDKRSVLVLVQEIQSEFKRLGIGDVEPDDWLTVDDCTWPKSLAGGHHHMGTTRMSESPKKGVVDAVARVHGTKNLYTAGSSIFPTIGCANPTLTIVATSLRLADHLEMQVTKLQAAPLVGPFTW
ncbi:MAG: GMC family oxidoreductase [Alphaproteobacteria bacterium]|nr:GMC family oxidoreductase [Alphaproteobacteria bacterium]